MRYCEKAIKFEKESPSFYQLLSNNKTKWESISNFVAFPEYLNFID